MSTLRARRTLKGRLCQRCGKNRNIQAFKGNEQVCRICKSKAKISGDNRVWDWANALTKSTSMHVGHAKGDLGIFSTALTPDMLRALMQYQHYKCAVSKMTLYLPETDFLIPIGMTLNNWIVGLPKQDQLLTPIVVRNSISGNWEPGNVVIIAKYLEPLYLLSGGASAIRRIAGTIAAIQPDEIPQAHTLKKLIRSGT